MKPELWSAVLAGVSALIGFVAACYSWSQARSAKGSRIQAEKSAGAAEDQAQSARTSATAASKSADAAVWQAQTSEKHYQLAKAEFDRADKPAFIIAAHRTTDWQVVVTVEVTAAPGPLRARISYVSEYLLLNSRAGGGDARQEPPAEEAERMLVVNSPTALFVAVPEAAAAGKVTLTMAISEPDADRTWTITQAAEWRHPGLSSRSTSWG